MSEKKLNCWEYMQCGREPGGHKVSENGVCIAATDQSFNGINRGKNAGRVCWAVAGTCCGGKVQGTFAEKRETCTCCQFYRQVQKEEGACELEHKLLGLFPEEERLSLLHKMSCKALRAGERFVRQGDILNSVLIIQRGSCLVIVEKNGALHPVDHRGPGEIIGVTSLLTGEPQQAHVEAETDMELWILAKSVLENISQKNPELFDLLTEIVSSRFDTKRPVADRQIGKYVASDIIGRGAFSIVYKGIHSSLNMPVAIKMMKHDLSMNEDFLEGFRKEARTIAKLNHANVIKVYDIEERFRTVFIVTELLEGRSLRALLTKRVKLPLERAFNFILQVCQGLRYAHAQGIVHQDIKPGNIFILPDDKIKILDFGLAAPCGSESCLTGTPYYMSPEQVQCLPVDERSDIFSLGLTTFEMITGRRPFTARNPWKAMEMRTFRSIPDPANFEPAIPNILREFILKACARAPGERYGSMSEILSDLQPLAKQLGLNNGGDMTGNRKLTTLFMVYNDQHRAALNACIDEFREKVRRIGVDLKAGEFLDL